MQMDYLTIDMYERIYVGEVANSGSIRHPYLLRDYFYMKFSGIIKMLY